MKTNDDFSSYRRAAIRYDSMEEFPNEPPTDPNEYTDEDPTCAQCFEPLPRAPYVVLGRLYCSIDCAISDSLARLPMGLVRHHQVVSLRRTL